MKQRGMLRVFGVAVAAFVLGGAGAAAAMVQLKGENNSHGSIYSHSVSSEYEIPLGVRSSGRQGKSVKFHEVRDIRLVPEFYGKLHTITPSSQGVVLWYVADDGALRNVAIEGVESNQYLLDRQVVSELEVKHYDSHGTVRRKK